MKPAVGLEEACARSSAFSYTAFATSCWLYLHCRFVLVSTTSLQYLPTLPYPNEAGGCPIPAVRWRRVIRVCEKTHKLYCTYSCGVPSLVPVLHLQEGSQQTGRQSAITCPILSCRLDAACCYKQYTSHYTMKTINKYCTTTTARTSSASGFGLIPMNQLVGSMQREPDGLDRRSVGVTVESVQHLSNSGLPSAELGNTTTCS